MVGRGAFVALACVLLASLTVAPAAGAATSVAFATQPSATNTAVTPFAVQPVVHVEDGGVPLAGAIVTLSIASGNSDATLTCTGGLTQPTDASGNAAFAGCAIDKVAAAYVLRATVGALTADSDPLRIQPGVASRLVFFAYPAATTYTRLTPEVVVAVHDAGGNLAVYFPPIRLTVNRSDSSLRCPDGLEQRAVTGFAEFKACTFAALGTDFRLIADDGPGGLAPVTGPPFAVVGGAPTELRVCWGPPPTCPSTAPSRVTGGVDLPIQPRVLLTDADGNVAILDNATRVTLEVAPGTPTSGGPGGLSCVSGLTVIASAGTANFFGCRIRNSGTAYRLRATASGLAAASSEPFSVAPGAPVRIGFVSSPASVVVNQPFAAAVAIQDAGGNTVPTGVSARIRLTLGNNPGATGFACDADEVTTTAGVATFTGCRINIRAGGFTLVAIPVSVEPAGPFASTESTPFRSVDAAAAITLTSSASAITWGQAVTLSIRIAARGADRQVRLEASGDGRTWATIASGRTDAAGRTTVPLTPDRNRRYRVAYDGSTDLGEGVSNVVRVVVRQIALLRPSNGGEVARIRSGSLLILTTTVRPARADLPRSTVRYLVARRVDGVWRPAATYDVTADASGRARLELQLTVGTWSVRAQALPTSANANSVWSPLEFYEVVAARPG
jgi:hypothetical protein